MYKTILLTKYKLSEKYVLFKENKKFDLKWFRMCDISLVLLTSCYCQDKPWFFNWYEAKSFDLYLGLISTSLWAFDSAKSCSLDLSRHPSSPFGRLVDKNFFVRNRCVIYHWSFILQSFILKLLGATDT